MHADKIMGRQTNKYELEVPLFIECIACLVKELIVVLRRLSGSASTLNCLDVEYIT